MKTRKPQKMEKKKTKVEATRETKKKKTNSFKRNPQKIKQTMNGMVHVGDLRHKRHVQYFSKRTHAYINP